MRREIVVLHGRVQGVGLRYRIVEIARVHAVSGTVANTSNGEVEIDVQGEDQAVTAFLDAIWVSKPRAARIDGAALRSEEPRDIEGFSVGPTR